MKKIFICVFCLCAIAFSGCAAGNYGGPGTNNNSMTNTGAASGLMPDNFNTAIPGQ